MSKRKDDELLLTAADNLNYLALCAYLGGKKLRRTDERTPRDKISDSLRLTLLRKQDYCCAECGIEFQCVHGQWKGITADHIIKFQYGGQANIHNIELVCKPCNDKRDTNYSIKVVEKHYGPIDLKMIQPFYYIAPTVNRTTNIVSAIPVSRR